MISRRRFLSASATVLGGAALSGCGPSSTKPHRVAGSIVGASAAAGHRLREGSFPAPDDTQEVEVAVLGGGIAGLSAARALRQGGVGDLVLLELENATGGNALSGRNEVSAYPWGAHYLPLPGDDCPEVQRLLEELGVITGRAPNGTPIYDETALCAEPMDRLLVHGTWQDGVVPRLDLQPEEQRQFDRFFAQMETLRQLHGSDGRPAFSIPVDRSSQDQAFRAWDRLSFAAYLANEGLTAAPLRWYVDYCCRDDYGADAANVSAWAGLHYFASRNARAHNAPSHAVLTWPEGNGWLAARLAEPVAAQIRTGALIFDIDPSPPGLSDHVTIDYLDVRTERTTRIVARAAVCALPRFVATRIVRPWREQRMSYPDLDYSPWMVANLTVASMEAALGGAPAWDNVLQRSPSLGYIVATHQHLAGSARDTVLTYYQPLDQLPPSQARRDAHTRSHESWCEQVFTDLGSAHPQLRQYTRQVDVWLWGHAMVRPIPGFMWGETRRRMQASLERLVFAHSDMSGLSLFEEAHVRGVHAAQQILRQLRRAA